VAGRIVGMDDDQPARAAGRSRGQSREINLPAVVIEQRIAHELDVAEIGQKIKQRIAGSRNKNFVARIAEQAKDERVRFAGSGSQNQIVSSYWDLLPFVISGDRFARTSDSARVRLINPHF